MSHRTPPGRQPQNDGLLSFRSSWKDGRVQSPTWAYPASSPVANFASTSISSMSSRGSWSSLFNTNNVRHLIGSGFDPTRDGGHGEPTAHEGGGLAGIPVPGNRTRKFSDIDSPRPRPSKSDSPQPLSPTSRADVSAARSLGSVAPSMAGQGRRPTFSQVAKARHTIVHKSVVVVDLQHELQQER
jgi:WD repeat-containing protein 59